ncbi:unannotated protein [freshwater metagenome]|uniref:Unannotated protein n=1 Tax=freshwater metagenome TaxID=449393 RepID=A0A6J6G904_9ZZZZ|nr:hypothetical protein [Actinomycetota bacterium]MSZ92812.1 hypothetical protein [Actinomycetota bacterium]
MSRRIEVELTSTREDGTWTWRAAGAKLPKGELNGSLLFDGAKVGDVVRADADFMMDGIDIIAVLAPKGARKEAERIEVVGTPRRDDEPLVTTKLAPKGRGGDRRDRKPRREGDGEKRDGRPPRDRKPRTEGEGSQDARRKTGTRAHHPNRPTSPAPEPKPKAKRLRAGRTHRNAALAALPAEQKPIAEQVLRGGIPAVRQAVEKQNETNKAEGKPEISPAPLLQLAEQLMPSLRSAEWRDKAEAALADLPELDLRDLRSVVVASDAGARDDETRALAEQLKTGLAQRVESEQAAWLTEISELLAGGRAVRALRVSSRPPKAGAPLPAELSAKLTEAAAASLTAETGQDRFATVLDALAFSPVRTQVTPVGIPAEPTPELVAAVKKVAARLPQIAALFGIEVTAPSKSKPAAKPRPPKPVIADAPAPSEASADAAAPVAVVEDDAPAIEVADAPETAVETTPEESAAAAVEEAPGDNA